MARFSNSHKRRFRVENRQCFSHTSLHLSQYLFFMPLILSFDIDLSHPTFQLSPEQAPAVPSAIQKNRIQSMPACKQAQLACVLYMSANLVLDSANTDAPRIRYDWVPSDSGDANLVNRVLGCSFQARRVRCEAIMAHPTRESEYADQRRHLLTHINRLFWVENYRCFSHVSKQCDDICPTT
jgi:hypothetical protein